MKLLKVSQLLLVAAILSLFTSNVYSQTPSSSTPEMEIESSHQETDYDKSLLVDAVIYDNVQFYTLRYNLELLKGKNISFNGNIGLGVIDPNSTAIQLSEGQSNELDIVVPVEAKLLIGQRKHFLELGLGAHLLFGLEKTNESLMEERPSGIQISRYKAAQESTSLWIYSNIAYRFQPKAEGGLFFHGGILPTVQSYTLAKSSDFKLGCNIGVGYTF